MWLRLLSWSAPVVGALLLTVPGRSEDTAPPGKPAVKSRKFLFTYASTLTGLEPGKKARVWVPVPPTNEDQDVRIVSRELPAEGKIDTEPKSGNRMLYLEAKADAEGKVPLKVVYEVTRR